jgi:hypothetical protein
VGAAEKFNEKYSQDFRFIFLCSLFLFIQKSRQLIPFSIVSGKFLGRYFLSSTGYAVLGYIGENLIGFFL